MALNNSRARGNARGVFETCAWGVSTHRCIRADKVATGVQGFVVSKMGERFVKPPVFDLNACFDDSSCATPLVFILSPGSDPMGAVLKAADGMGVKVMRGQAAYSE